MRIIVISKNSDLNSNLNFCLDGWGYEVFQHEPEKIDVNTILKLAPDAIIVDVSSQPIELLEMCDFLKGDFGTKYIPVIALIKKDHLREKLLNLKQGIDDYIMHPVDPLDLRIRVEMAVKRTQHSFYANSLTGLPGGIVIQEMLNEKNSLDAPFVIGHVDIDNFKSFNDKYGYSRGDSAILQTAHMLTMSTRTCGNKNDFVGHIGGDDFIIMTTPDKYKSICQNFICMFDTIIPFQYDPIDRDLGYIMAKNRAKRMQKIPLMSVTIALVLRNSKKEFTGDLIEINERITEVKHYLKKIPGSKYMADRRVDNKNDHLTLQVFNNEEELMDFYKPLGQILLERNVITRQQLETALKAHWKRGIFLGQILKEYGYVCEDDLVKALESQEESLNVLDGEKAKEQV
ncbi:MAG: diguanylate cyclase [Candidatus Omnitrophica bacterium]|nr:diguanylate cyclase [Candidatus Omnitrophota bacterium]